MVCMLGQRRMAAMVRLLMVENVPDITPAEEVTHEKIAAQIIHKEFLDADEANLLEEEDMHIFECRPLTDPLHLVRCNSCKKPIKASQYAAHSERCRLLAPIRDTALDLEVDSGHKKPPRKGRKMSQATNGSILLHKMMLAGQSQSLKIRATCFLHSLERHKGQWIRFIMSQLPIPLKWLKRGGVLQFLLQQKFTIHKATIVCGWNLAIFTMRHVQKNIQVLTQLQAYCRRTE
ncbi:uncharacterized protein [Typha latifolia]|uniref:uncharacterized protein isoform X6 n=1 Tax=Typha latifolia TaxID=4733 RepID=UPI003C2E5C52